MKEVRSRMAAGEKLPHCSRCFEDEALGRMSYRLRSNDLWLGDRSGAAALKQMIEQSADGVASLDPSYFDLRLGNICNLKCTICKPLYSSQIERDPAHAPWITDAPYTRLANRFGTADEWFDAEALPDEIMEMSGNLAMIQLAGGEPTINRTQIAFLKKLCAAGRAPVIDLTVVTNLIAVQPDVFATLAQFKSLFVIVSVDGYGETYEYVRYPGKWPALVRNIGRLRQLRPDIRIRIDAVLQAINALNVPDLFEWADSQEIPIELWFGRGLDQYNDFRILPHDIRKQFAARFEDYFVRKGNRDMASVRQNVETIIAEAAATDFSEQQRSERAINFMHFINDLDSSRKLSFRTIAPDIHDAMSSYLGGWHEETRHAVGPTKPETAVT
jgi:MoaA/NifB/PqqE/SkfB family radical SAM enzyme